MKRGIFYIILAIVLLIAMAIIVWSSIVPGNSNHDTILYQKITCSNEQIFEILDSNYTCIDNEKVSLNIQKKGYSIKIEELKILSNIGSEHQEEIINVSDIEPNGERTKILKKNYSAMANISIVPILNLNSKRIECLPDSTIINEC